ncbi:hypothetical protein LCM10_00960 [Rossellomorea aquimaris]|uniref:hypothetical protein n=1 Tax=Rossellomorea aquimaris TaxID=189382 RepID=UPI001CD34D2A|nr:hypothetical protein [Rossellomorea aquimaris]MCA1053537.1 hypothetical protein [Rossellomorea aquimaris]
MSLKAIELQIALPRTFDAAKQVERQHADHLLVQTAAGIELEKELKKKRHTATQMEQKGDAVLHNGIVNDQPPSIPSAGIHQEKDCTPEHPYKGKKIDYSG